MATIPSPSFSTRSIKTLLTSICFVFICLIISVRSASGQSTGKKSLSGLNGVNVKVVVGEDIKEVGLNEGILKSNTELQLRKAGIKVYTEGERSNTPAAPILLIHVGGYNDGGLLAYTISVELIQVVRTTAGNRTAGATWLITPSVGMIGVNNVRDLTDSVRQEARIFINDWLAVKEN